MNPKTPLITLVLASAASATAACTPQPQYQALTEQTAAKYGLPPYLLTALVQQESNFCPTARSSAGAMGLGQLMPGTAASLGVKDPYDPVQNLDGAARYLRQQFLTFKTWPLALAAYNAGPGAVTKYNNTIPPYAETQNYVRRILSGYATLAAKPTRTQLTASTPNYPATASQFVTLVLPQAKVTAGQLAFNPQVTYTQTTQPSTPGTAPAAAQTPTAQTLPTTASKPVRNTPQVADSLSVAAPVTISTFQGRLAQVETAPTTPNSSSGLTVIRRATPVPQTATPDLTASGFLATIPSASNASASAAPATLPSTLTVIRRAR